MYYKNLVQCLLISLTKDICFKEIQCMQRKEYEETKGKQRNEDS